jgi:hypothetical protein
VRVCATLDAAPVAAALRDALDLLIVAGRIRWADRGDRADLLHTVGDVETADGAPHRVHTVHRIPLRTGSKPAATRRWVLTERHRHVRGSVWLAHGRTAARMVVEAGLAPGERVRCLPLLSPWRLDIATEQGTCNPAQRVAVRRELGVRPGVRLVVDVTRRSCPAEVDGWPSAVRRLQRTDVQVLCPLGGDRMTVPLPVLLTAGDLIVTTGSELTATSAAVPALAAGVPVVTVTTDPAADLVEAGRTGLVVAPRLDAVVDAVVAWLDNGPASWRRGPERSAQPVRPELARCLLGAYGDALTSTVPRRYIR